MPITAPGAIGSFVHSLTGAVADQVTHLIKDALTAASIPGASHIPDLSTLLGGLFDPSGTASGATPSVATTGLVGSGSMGGGTSDTIFGGGQIGQASLPGQPALTFAAGSNDSATIMGGTTLTTLFGGSAGSIIGSLSTTGSLHSAASANDTLGASAASLSGTVWGSQGLDSLMGSKGVTTLAAGQGATTMFGGGSGVMQDFLAGAGSILGGYDSTGAAGGLSAVSASGGSATIALSDHTKITFLDISNLKNISS